jgi:hypothetical protein
VSQDDKYFLGIAGEFAVASELNRRGLLASITYGTSKSADVIVVDKDVKKVVRVEVKTTNKKKWPLGPKVTDPTKMKTNSFWVLVQFPDPLNGTPKNEDKKQSAHSPRFFVLTGQEIHGVWKKEADVYKAGYLKRHNKEPEGIGVPNVSLIGVSEFEDEWEKIADYFRN